MISIRSIQHSLAYTRSLKSEWEENYLKVDFSVLVVQFPVFCSKLTLCCQIHQLTAPARPMR